ncbi:MAG: hypothetical protein D6795_10300 [Deltaproteobacteria bacterium]|nr:MAG: hypothetical protein D6795_10300 [Deltaproteobacteria bacterium]
MLDPERREDGPAKRGEATQRVPAPLPDLFTATDATSSENAPLPRALPTLRRETRLARRIGSA